MSWREEVPGDAGVEVVSSPGVEVEDRDPSAGPRIGP